METPKWADQDSSQELNSWIEAGESASQEFKESIPENVRKLAQEIAAIGTSGGGRLLLGVSDDGNVVGIPASNAKERDSCFERVQGIADTIRPDIDVDLRFAVHGELVVLLILVPEQSEPVFYVDHRPYVRDQRRSRPARPGEVVECIWKHPCSETKLQAKRATNAILEASVEDHKRFLDQNHRGREAFLDRRR